MSVDDVLSFNIVGRAKVVGLGAREDDIGDSDGLIGSFGDSEETGLRLEIVLAGSSAQLINFE
jgi:hypothetical protein